MAINIFNGKNKMFGNADGFEDENVRIATVTENVSGISLDEIKWVGQWQICVCVCKTLVNKIENRVVK